MFMPFYYYRNSKCLGRAVSGTEKKFIPNALIGYCGYFHFSLLQLELLFCRQFTEVLRFSADTSRAWGCQTLVLNYWLHHDALLYQGAPSPILSDGRG